MDKSTDKQPLTPELEARVQRAVDNFMQGCCGLRRWSRAYAHDVRCRLGHRYPHRIGLRTD